MAKEMFNILAFERREKIMHHLYRDKKAFVSTLAEEFKVTEETIRRDFEKMEKEGIVTRTYGGATLNLHTNEDLPYQTRNAINIEAKKNIASKMNELLHDGDTIMADTSSTVLESLKEIQLQKSKITLITNSIIALQEFSNSSFTIISTGGELRTKSMSLVGTVSASTVEHYNADIALLSCKSLSMTHGITDSNDPEGDLKRNMAKKATKVILLADHTKFDKVAFVKIMNFDQINCIITDQKPSKEWLEFLNSKSIELIF